jgi:hypothetical protein
VTRTYYFAAPISTADSMSFCLNWVRSTGETPAMIDSLRLSSGPPGGTVASKPPPSPPPPNSRCVTVTGRPSATPPVCVQITFDQGSGNPVAGHVQWSPPGGAPSTPGANGDPNSFLCLK